MRAGGPAMKSTGFVFYVLTAVWTTIAIALYIAFSSGKWSEGALQGALFYSIPVLPLLAAGWMLRHRAARQSPSVPLPAGENPNQDTIRPYA
jgi:hypothetical protein